MKKIYLTLGLGALFLGATAQQLKVAQQSQLGKAHVKSASSANRLGNPASTYSVTIDTLRPTSITGSGCGTTGLAYYLAYSTPDSGYAFGTSIPQTFTYNTGSVVTVTATTSALAQKYNVGSAAATITNVLVLPGVGSGTTTTTQASVYDGTLNTLTGATLLGTSNAVPMSAYASAMTATTVAQGYVSYSFTTAVSVAANANFYVSATLPSIGGSDKDTIAVLTTTVGCSSNSADSLSWVQTTYQVPGFGNQVQWAPIKRLFGTTNNVDLMIFPVIDISGTTSINNYVSHGGLKLYAASPNPTNSIININFSLDKSSKVDVDIYDITGKVVKTISNNGLAAGNNSIAVDASTLEAGSYLYSINANGNKMFSKFVVTK